MPADVLKNNNGREMGSSLDQAKEVLKTFLAERDKIKRIYCFHLKGTQKD